MTQTSATIPVAGSRGRVRPLLFLPLLSTLAWPITAWGESNRTDTAAAADVILVIDRSGSMKSKESDGRYGELFRWLNAFCRPDDRVGVVAMGHGARLVSPLTPATAFDPGALRPALRDKERFTDVSAGLERAYYHLRSASGGRGKIIVLYSDAKIDLPGGKWASRDALRYLSERLGPDLAANDIRLIAIVPDGLTANFQLLHELSTATAGGYFRGIPDDGAAVRSGLDEPRAVRTGSAPVAPESGAPPLPPAPVAAAQNGSDATPVAIEGAAPVPTSPDISVETGELTAVIIAVAAVLIGMLGVVIFLLGKQLGGPGRRGALSQALEEVHALKQMTSRRRVSQLPAEDMELPDVVNEPYCGEPTDAISLGVVAPFLEYERAEEGREERPRTDDIAAPPAFSDEAEGGESLSVATMETLLGTAMGDIEDRN